MRQLTLSGAQAGISRIEEEITKGSLTVSAALAGRQLSEYKRILGIRDLGIKLTQWIMQLAMAYNIKGNISENQAIDIADGIMKDFWWMKLAELALFFDQAKSGKFGKVYDRIDKAVIYEWLNLYCANERAEELERRNQQHKNLTPPKEAIPVLLEKLFKPLERMKEQAIQDQKEQSTVESRNRKNLLIQWQRLNDWFPRELEQIELVVIRWNERRHAKGYEIQHVVLEQFMNYRRVKTLLEKINKRS